MRNILLTIEYDGTNFKGWQIQRRGERTVSGEILKAIDNITGEHVKLIGSGRTDTGVHASGQTANFKLPFIEGNKNYFLGTKHFSCQHCKKLQNALNANLPNDIAVISVKKAPIDFHAQYNIKKKTYRYTILNRPARSALYHSTALHWPHPIDISKMREAAKIFIGKHDFAAFQSNNRSNQGKSTVRTIESLKINKRNNFITINITANGFLYKMVRNIVGTLIEAGSGKITQPQVTLILKSQNRREAGFSVKPHGLTLIKSSY